MKHTIFTRINFEDKKLRDEYLAITKDVLIPSLKSQTNQNFTWIILTSDADYLRKELDYPFITVDDGGEYIRYAINNGINIQTRHDCDDYMAPDYIETIQELYSRNIKLIDSFLIQSQPLKLMYHEDIIKKIKPYHSKRCSMHLSLCQKNVVHHINERKHGQMHEIASHVITLREGITKWVIHGNNISVIGRKK